MAAILTGRMGIIGSFAVALLLAASPSGQFNFNFQVSLRLFFLGLVPWIFLFFSKYYY
jgi:hypothetical protein